MKVITKFECEKCGQIYDTEEAAVNCENGHGFPESIVDYQYRYEDLRYGYPRTVTIKMSNGNLCEYFYGKKVET